MKARPLLRMRYGGKLRVGGLEVFGDLEARPRMRLRYGQCEDAGVWKVGAVVFEPEDVEVDLEGPASL